MDLSNEDTGNLEALEKYAEYEWFVEAKKLTPGSTFGEIALVKDVNRSATIHCICNCYFETLNKVDF